MRKKCSEKSISDSFMEKSIFRNNSQSIYGYIPIYYIKYKSKIYKLRKHVKLIQNSLKFKFGMINLKA